MGSRRTNEYIGFYLERSAFGFEIDRNFYQRAKDEMLKFEEEKQM